MTRKNSAMALTAQELRNRINRALRIASKSHCYMEYPDDNHTMHFLNEMVYALAPEKYERMVKKHICWYFGTDPEDED